MRRVRKSPPVVFVHPLAREWADWTSRAVPPDPDDDPARFRMGRDHLVTQTFFRLKLRGCDVTLSERFVRGAINVAHCDDLELRKLPLDSFVIGIQNDRFAPSACDLRVVPSTLMQRTRRDFFLPYYTQTGMLPRDAARGGRIERMAFFGIAKNLSPEYRTPAFVAALRSRGIELVFRETDWHDYRDVDLILAVRTGYSEQFLRHKPATKLYNAWAAGAAALLGPEPAYRAERRSELDYFEVAAPEEALAAVDRLLAEPGLYRRVVAGGLARASEMTHERVTDAWEQFLWGPCLRAQRRWQRGGSVLRRPERAVRFALRALRHRADRKRWWNEDWWTAPGAQV